jgi:hypothetical protein
LALQPPPAPAVVAEPATAPVDNRQELIALLNKLSGLLAATIA